MTSSKRSQPAQDSPRETLHERLAYSEFSRDRPLPQDPLARPEPPAVQQELRVQASRKGRKGKTVSVISGFEAKPQTLTELCKKLKAQCGAGGTVKDKEIEIQGDHRQKLVQALSQLGYRVKVSGG